MRLKLIVGVQLGTGSLGCHITVLSIALRDSASPQGMRTWRNAELLFLFFQGPSQEAKCPQSTSEESSGQESR